MANPIIKYYRMRHYSLSDRYYRSYDDISGIVSAVGDFEEVTGKEANEATGYGRCRDELKVIDYTEALEVLSS